MALSTTVVDTALLKRLIGERRLCDIFAEDDHITSKTFRQWLRGEVQPDAGHFLVLLISARGTAESYPELAFLVNTDDTKCRKRLQTFVRVLMCSKDPREVAKAVNADLASVYRWYGKTLPSATYLMRLIECHHEWMKEENEASPEALFLPLILIRNEYAIPFRDLAWGSFSYPCRLGAGEKKTHEKGSYESRCRSTF